jgi:hypothetical protein
MVRTEFGLGDGKGPLEGGAGGRQLAKREKDDPQIVEGAGHVEVVGTKLSLADLQSALASRAGGG